MYDKRIKIFSALFVVLLAGVLLRLAQMQLTRYSSIRRNIAELKRQRGLSRQLNAVRGDILDRNSRVLATDRAGFYLQISYQLSQYMDERVFKSKLLAEQNTIDKPDRIAGIRKQWQLKRRDIQRIIRKCEHFGIPAHRIESRIKAINDNIWRQRRYLAWKRNFPEKEFENAVQDPNHRLRLIRQVNIAEMHRSFPLLELETEDDIFTAQLEFAGLGGVNILARAERIYPYGDVAAQTIGWMGPAEGDYKLLFSDDEFLKYLKGELCGKRPGVEYVCEAVLRGKRGQVIYDIDGKAVSRSEPQFGRDITLTLDIELQRRIEDFLNDCRLNSNCNKPTAAVVMNAASGELLALISLPDYDLNNVRYNYDQLAADTNQPLINRTINKHYPPGSVVKPLVLIAGLENGEIGPTETISCPAKPAPKGWPNCWIYNKYHSIGHDDQWRRQGGNNAHNAIKGSCNIYFSRLANRINQRSLQRWLYGFGYGHSTELLLAAQTAQRDFLQGCGQISSVVARNKTTVFDRLTPLANHERRFFGIGQGNLRATTLQMANAMATICRGGIFKQPQLFIDSFIRPENDPCDLSINNKTIRVVCGGMNAVVAEPGGTAYKQFQPAAFAEQSVTVYGKTGSTQAPKNACFAGFARDNSGRAIALAVVVEGAEHGSADAAPLAREIIQFCIEAGYLTTR